MAVFSSVTERNLILTGYIGPNQPLLGRQIAERLRMPFINVENVIAERVDLPVDEIRAYYGETRLKAIEGEIMQETLLRRGTVIRVSGRTLLHSGHLARLQETGPVMCLVISLDAMLQRLHVSMGARYHNPHERALALGQLRREWAVRTLPGLVEIDTTYISEADIITTVIARWQELSLIRG